MLRIFRKTSIVLLMASVFVFGFAIASNATTMVAGTAFDDNAFVDSLLGYSGSYIVFGGVSLEAAITDSDLWTYAGSYDSGAYLDLAFTDNFMINNAGPDLALYELGVPANFDVSIEIGGVTHTYVTSVIPGYTADGFDVTGVFIDMSDFGFGAGASVSTFRLGMDNESGSLPRPSLAVAAALNSATSVPDASIMWLLGSSLLGLGVFSRKSKKS